jgi:hypothetical protein
VEVLSAGVAGAAFCLFCWTTIFGFDCMGDAIVVVDGVIVVVDVATVEVVEDSGVDSEEMVLSTDDIVNNDSAPTDANVKNPAAVQFPGDAHDTEVNAA